MKKAFSTAARRLRAPALLLAAIWAVSLADLATGGAISARAALVPRRLDGLDGVLASPFLHVSLAHLAANTVPAAILGGLVAAAWPGRFATTTLVVIVVGGLATWLFGREAAHIGASGLVFGWFGFLAAAGFRRRSLGAAAVALLVVALYGPAMLLGVLPQGGGISWEGHLFGALAGALSARAIPRR